MPDRDYYDVLGVARDASAGEIRKAYLELARTHHPDLNPGDKSPEDKFKEARQAYDILFDAEKRSLYDRFGKAAFEGMAASGPRAGATEWTVNQAGPGGFTFDFGEFFGQQGGVPPGAGAGAAEETHGAGGIFDELLGRVRGGRRPAGPRPGRHLEAQLGTPFADDAFPAPGTPEWGSMNRRRADLIRKKNRQGLTPEELSQFERLQQRCFAALDESLPTPIIDEDELRRLRESL